MYIMDVMDVTATEAPPSRLTADNTSSSLPLAEGMAGLRYILWHIPYCSGILEVPSNFELYSDREKDMHETFVQACKSAKFARGEETVLDKTHRKAGKMDPKKFVTRRDVEATGLLNMLRFGLLSKNDEKRTACELRQTTQGRPPRGQCMFSSVVVVFPTPHEVGAIILPHEDEELLLLSGRKSSIVNSWTEGMKDPLESLEKWLKGSDTALLQACSERGVA
ncbi:hypothetical protein LXA43DRAFT_1060984 [Ganoderma leucocontextum]|nr:hypothetical protein LXA43DRAFT_1060984 [Ganoderma leucocontextum]